ncbi:aldo/keto reductase [Weissella sagaensis]|jgi:diketogulonate reductase-like aldo/keto reductase|uniref:aldo/keto reductase n=1 Tax=Weissella sagaensis TaxID=2559928 RepID=UPI00123AC023|nr:aldo/keto reductase [Weissella sagaensis]KAA8434578.1 aldo/keto reductase [Weissella paramesenteroides]KAA8437537.1 aldo/keto reductase [Weissella paramesenteroides]
MDITTKLQLADGYQMPQQGLGLYKVTDQENLTQVVKTAWQTGYRLFDTAQMYQNEAEVGNALQSLDVSREDYFVTTKVAEKNQGYDATLASVEQSLKDLQMDYVDLLMVHWPLHEQFFDTWRAFERLQEEGLVKSLGTSNFGMIHLQYLATQANEMPVVNQIENHPHLVQPELRNFLRENDIVTQAWAPLGRGSVLAEPVIIEIAEKYHKSPAQVVLRWHLANGTSIIPKSVHPQRVIENGDIYDFSLTVEEMITIDNLNNFTRISQEPEQVYERGSQYPHH